jgi:hypothetical protein
VGVEEERDQRRVMWFLVLVGDVVRGSIRLVGRLFDV